MISLDCDDLFDTWRQQARWLLSHEVDPSRVGWAAEGVGDLFASDERLPEDRGRFRRAFRVRCSIPWSRRHSIVASNAGVFCMKCSGV